MAEDGRAGADNPGVVAPPPLLYAGGLVTGLVANLTYPVRFLPGGVSRALGWPLVAAGLAVGEHPAVQIQRRTLLLYRRYSSPNLLSR